MPCYFFSGKQYIRVTRGQLWPGTVDAGYPAPISNWGWGTFGANGIDAALSSGPVDYFFSGKQYIRVSRGTIGPGTIDPGYPTPISNWGWGAFGANGIDAALASDTKDYFFSGNQYIRVSRADTGPGKVDPGYPAPISNWGWGAFGADGIDAALNSGEVDYFFSGNQYIRVTRGETGPGVVNANYPQPISQWGWGAFGKSGIKAALWSGTDFSDAVTTPGHILGSNFNYPIQNNCSPLTDVTVTVDLFTDLTFTANGAPLAGLGSATGYTWQLNCFSSSDETDAAQQYVIGLRDGEIIGQIDNWKVDKKTEVYNSVVNLQNSPSPKTIPAGYKLRIILSNDAIGNITGATFAVYDGTGAVAGSQTIILPAADIAPIVAFQMNLVGPASGESVTLASGSGTITYTASNQLSVKASTPDCIDVMFSTVETSNCIYGELSATSSYYVQQTFNINGSAQPFSLTTDKFRHALMAHPLKK